MEYEILYDALYEAGMSMVSRYLILTFALVVFNSGVLAIIVKKLRNDFLGKKKEREQQALEQAAESEALKDLLSGIAHERIAYLADKVIERNYITASEYDNLSHLYKPYKTLHENGKIANRMKKVEAIYMRLGGKGEED